MAESESRLPEPSDLATAFEEIDAAWPEMHRGRSDAASRVLFLHMLGDELINLPVPILRATLRDMRRSFKFPSPSIADFVEAAKRQTRGAVRRSSGRSDLDPLLRPVEPATIEWWLCMLAMLGLPNTPGEGVFTERVAQYRLALRDLPTVCWTEATLAGAMRTFRFWPMPAELIELLEPIASDAYLRLNPQVRP